MRQSTPNTAGTTSVTAAEVLAAVEKASIIYHEFREEASVEAHSAIEIAARIAYTRGFVDDHQQYASLASRIRQYVTPGQVKKHLRALAIDGKIFAAKGDHFVATGYGHVAKATYFISHEGAAIKASRADAKSIEARDKRALLDAEQHVLGMHAAEVLAERDRLIAAYPPPEHAARLVQDQEVMRSLLREGL